MSRRSWAGRAVFQLHLWTGLGVGGYALAISLSGAVLVFAPQLGARAHASLRALPADAAASRDVRSPAQALDDVRRALPGRPLLNVQVAPSPHHAHVVGLLDGRAYRVVFVHPVTGDVSSPVRPRGRVVGWLEEFHSNFFSGRTGRVVNGIGGMLLVGLALTGAVLWWPGRGRVRRALRIDWRAGWKRIVFDLHYAIGFWLLVPTLVLAVTGAYFTWPQAYRRLVAGVSPLTTQEAPRSVPPAGPGRAASIDALVASVRTAAPDLPRQRVDLPGGPRAPVVIVATRAPDDAPRLGATFYFDRYAGTLLAERRGSQARSAGDHLLEWIGPLHTGHFGGLLVHVAWALAGLAPSVLVVTGVLMWWNRVVVPRRRGQRPSA